MLFQLFLPYPLGFCIFSFYEWQFRESHSLFKGLIKCLCEAEGSGGQFVLPFPNGRDAAAVGTATFDLGRANAWQEKMSTL